MKKIALLFIVPLLLFGSTVQAEGQKSIEKELIYDILVDRYNNGDPTLSEQVDVDDPFAYNGGDLRGIINKLDQIKGLGVTTISLSPIMENAPNGYHGYWIEDFYTVEEQYGTMEDLKELVKEAHDRDLKVVLEFVTNYVALTHPIVADATKVDWLEKNLLDPTDSTTWLKNIAVLNQDNKEVSDYLLDVASFWINETEIDGLKLHAVDQSSVDFLVKLSEHIKALNPDLYVLANVLDNNAAIDEIQNIPTIDAVENYKMYDILDRVFTQVEEPISGLYDSWDETGTTDLMFIDNKYTARFSNNARDNDRSTLTAWQLALTYMYTTPGIPVIYQGSEIPMYGPGFPESQDLVKFNSTDPDIEEFHNRISAIHDEFPVLTYGDFEHVGDSEAMSVFKRTLDDVSMYIAINNDSESRSLTVTDIDPSMQLRGLIGDDIVREKDNGEFKISIPRETAEVYVIEENKGFNWYLIGATSGVFILFIISIILLSLKQRKRLADEKVE